jgi:hypothetical protein
MDVDSAESYLDVYVGIGSNIFTESNLSLM